jgi:hypothetical protein
VQKQVTCAALEAIKPVLTAFLEAEQGEIVGIVGVETRISGRVMGMTAGVSPPALA